MTTVPPLDGAVGSRAAPPSAQWQPIETIPTDGTPVLVWMPKSMLGSNMHVALKRTGTAGYSLIGTHFWSDAAEAYSEPMYWTPLPEGPTT